MEKATQIEVINGTNLVPANTPIDLKEYSGYKSVTAVFNGAEQASKVSVMESDNGTDWAIVDGGDLVTHKKNIGYIGFKKFLQFSHTCILILSNPVQSPMIQSPRVLESTSNATDIRVTFDDRIEFNPNIQESKRLEGFVMRLDDGTVKHPTTAVISGVKLTLTFADGIPTDYKFTIAKNSIVGGVGYGTVRLGFKVGNYIYDNVSPDAPSIEAVDILELAGEATTAWREIGATTKTNLSTLKIVSAKITDRGRNSEHNYQKVVYKGVDVDFKTITDSKATVDFVTHIYSKGVYDNVLRTQVIIQVERGKVYLRYLTSSTVTGSNLNYNFEAAGATNLYVGNFRLKDAYFEL